MKIPVVRTRDLLAITDFNKQEILSIFKFAKKLKTERKKCKANKLLCKKSLAMIFEKSSTRTRVSFETGMYQLSGNALFLSSEDIQLGRGESFEDTAKVLSRYVDAIMIRTDSHEKIVKLAEYSTIPIINGLTDEYHPCQAMTDFYTIYEEGMDFSKIKLTYLGDGNNMAHSLLLGAAILGVDISLACPKEYSPNKGVVETAQKLAQKSGSKIEITDNIKEAAKGADVIYTDVWTSMGQEKESTERKKAFSKYKISMELLKLCSSDCKIMHCLPAHRGEEIDGDVIESKNSIIFEQAENRLHVQKAIMCALMGKKK